MLHMLNFKIQVLSTSGSAPPPASVGVLFLYTELNTAEITETIIIVSVIMIVEMYINVTV